MMMSDLPNDLVEEILSRIPTTTLIRLRPTCKKWNALINDRIFTQTHLSKASKQNMVVMLKHFRVYLMAVDLHGTRNNIFDPSVTVSGKLSIIDPRYDSEADISNIFHCDGLLLCTTKDNTRLVVWNPCTGQTNWIERRNEYYHECEKLYGNYNIFHDEYVFGYENNSSSPNYKIVRVMFCAHIVEIYELNSKTWRVLELTPDRCISSYGVPLKGNTYWFCGNNLPQVKDPCMLISFDFTTERFGCLSLPVVRGEYWKNDLSSVKDEQLSVLFLLEHKYQIEIWVTNEINPNFVSWGKSFRVDVMALRTAHEYPNHMNFFFDEEKKVVVYYAAKPKEGGHLNAIMSNMIYIAGKDGLLRGENFGETSTFDCPFLLMSYVPSLVKI